MADDSVKITIVADASGAVAGMNQTAEATKTATVSAKDFAAALQAAGGNLSKIGPDLLGTGNAAKRKPPPAWVRRRPASRAWPRRPPKAEKATKGLNFATSGFGIEVERIGHEILTGNFSRVPGSLMVAASRVGALQSVFSQITPAMLGFGAAAGVAAAGLALIAIRAGRASEELGVLRDAFAGRGGAAVTTSLKVSRKRIADLPGTTQEAVEKISQSLASIHGGTVALGGAIIDLAPGIMRTTSARPRLMRSSA